MASREHASRNLLRALVVAISASVLTVGLPAPAQADPALKVAARGPHDAVPAGSVAYVDGNSLIIAIPKGDGGGAAAIYETVGDPKTLLNWFKAESIVDRAIPTFTVANDGVTADAADGQAPVSPQALPEVPVNPRNCSGANYGPAPRDRFQTSVFWSDPNSCLSELSWAGTNPQVYYRDYTPARWPVGAAISTWNSGSPDIRADLIHRTSGSCPVNCVNVYNAYYGSSLWSGYAYVEWNGNYNYISGAVAIHFNESLAANGNRDRKTACHEIGHTLGLGHASAISFYTSPPANQGYVNLGPVYGWANTCMHDSWVGSPRFPSSGDRNILRYISYAD